MTTKDILEYLKTLTKEQRYELIREIEDYYCLLCGAEQVCYCSPHYDE